MNLRVIGAGTPRTGSLSLRGALEFLLGGRCCHMSTVPGQPFDLQDGWKETVSGRSPDWPKLLDGYVAALDWPVSLHWRGLCRLNPTALVILSVREFAEAWWQSIDRTVLRQARCALAPDWARGRDLIVLLERFAGSRDWDDAATMEAAYERHNAAVRAGVPPNRLLKWRATEGWAPLCRALDLPVPAIPFPWANRAVDWPEKF